MEDMPVEVWWGAGAFLVVSLLILPLFGWLAEHAARALDKGEDKKQ